MTYIGCQGRFDGQIVCIKRQTDRFQCAVHLHVEKSRAFSAPLENLGFSKSTGNPALDFPVVIVLDGTSNFDHPAINYTVKTSKKGPVSGAGKK